MGHLVELLEPSIGRVLSRVIRRSTVVIGYSDVRLVGTDPKENGEIGGRFWAVANYKSWPLCERTCRWSFLPADFLLGIG